MHTFRLRVAASLALLMLFSNGLTAIAQQSPELPAQQRPVQLDIKAQPLAAALTDWANQTGFMILIRLDIAADIMSPKVAGNLTPENALKQLLAASKLGYEFVDSKTVAVLPPSSRSDQSSLHSTEGQTKSETPQKSPGDSLRLAQTNLAVPGELSSTKTSDPNSQKDSTQKAQLEEIVVTAQKRAERLIDTPQSVSVVTADDLNRLGATQFRDFANTVPGLDFTTQGAGWTQIAIRGVTTGQDLGSTVGVYVDDIPYGSTSSFANGAHLSLDVGLFDLNRIEVLRGPQGTLYGASTLGGLIKYVTRQPDRENFNGEVQAGLSGTEDGGISYNVAGVLNAPLVTDKAALRVSAFQAHDGGFIDDPALGQQDVNRSDIYGGRADLLLTPTEALSIRIGGFVQNISRDGEGNTDYTFNGTPLYGSLDQHRLVAEPFDQHFRLASGSVTYDLGPATLTSISSYQQTRTAFVQDLSLLYAPYCAFVGLSCNTVGYGFDFATNKFTQEVRLASGQSSALEWLVGGFYTHEASAVPQQFNLQGLGGEPLPNELFTLSQNSRYEEYAGFGDLTWHITGKLDASGGIRYAHNDQSYTQIGSGLFGLSAPTARSADHVFTYLGNARYHFSDLATGYLRYATGYRPGGPNFVTINATTGLPTGPASFEADQLKSYEIGFKAQTPEQHFALDIAAYYIDWSNIQISVIRGGFGAIANASGGAAIKGAELSLSARPIDGLALSSAFAYQDAYVKNADANLQAAAGERLPNVPRFTAAMNADYRFWEGGLQPTIGGTLRYVTDRTTSFNGSVSYPQYRLPAYTTFDLRASLLFNRFDVQLYARNLFDEHGQLSAFTAYGTAQVALLQPRTVGFNIVGHF